MEIVDTPNELGNTNKVFKIISQIIFFIILLFIVYLDFNNDNSITLLIIRVLISAFTSLVIAHYAWIIADIVRNWIMPGVLITSGAMDALKQKIFWLYGPQFFTSIASTLIFYIIFNVSIGYFFNIPSFFINSGQTINSTNTPLSSPQTPNSQFIESSPTTKNEVVQTNLPTDTSSINPVINDQKLTEEKLSIKELEEKANYSGDDPVIRARLGLPPKN